jgi:hypothetical protein
MRSIPKEADRCTFVSADGRRCCMNRVTPNASLCFNHWQRQRQQDDTARIGDEIVGAAGALNTQEGIHQALTNVFANLARGRISPRSAAVLAYVGQLMLVSRPSLERTLKFNLAVAAVAQKAAQQKVKSEAADADRLRKHALLELEISNGTLNLFQALRSLSPEEGMRFLRFVRDFSDKAESARPASPSSAAPSETPSATPQSPSSTKPGETPCTKSAEKVSA